MISDDFLEFSFVVSGHFLTILDDFHVYSIEKHQNMEGKKGVNFFFVIIAIISGRALLKKYDPEIFKFDNPLSSLVYIIYILGFVTSIFGLLMNYKNRTKK